MLKKLICLLIVISGFTAAALAESGTKILAVVGDDVITHNDMQKRFNVVIATNNIQISDDTQRQVLSRQVLQALVNEKIFLQEAKKLKIKASQEELDDVIAGIEKQQNIPAGHFDEFLQSKNIAKTDAIAQINNSIIWDKILEKIIVPQVQVSNAELNEYIEKEHPKEMVVDLYLFSTDAANVKQLEKTKMSLKDCTTVAKAKLADNVKQERIQCKSKDLPVILKDKMIAVEVGQKTPTFSNADKREFFVLCEKKFDLTFTQTGEIRGRIMDKKIGLQSDYYMKNLSKKTYIEIFN